MVGAHEALLFLCVDVVGVRATALGTCGGVVVQQVPWQYKQQE